MTHGRGRTGLGERRLAQIATMPVAQEQSVRFAFACAMERYVAFSREYEPGWDDVSDVIHGVIEAWMAAWWSAVPDGSIDANRWNRQLDELEMESEMPVGLLMVWARSVQTLGLGGDLRDDLSDLTLDLCNGVMGSLTYRLPAARRDLWYSEMSPAERDAEMLNVWGGHPASLLVLDQLQDDLASSVDDLDVAPERARLQGRQLANLSLSLDSVDLPHDGPLDDPFWD